MTLEQEMRNELHRIERELDAIDDELEKLHARAAQLMVSRKKKEHDLRILRSNFDMASGDVQTTLERLLREK